MPKKKKPSKKNHQYHCKKCIEWEKRYDVEKIASNKKILLQANKIQAQKIRLEELGGKVTKLEQKCDRKRKKKKKLKGDILKMEKKISLWAKFMPNIQNMLKISREEKNKKILDEKKICEENFKNCDDLLNLVPNFENELKIGEEVKNKKILDEKKICEENFKNELKNEEKSKNLLKIEKSEILEKIFPILKIFILNSKICLENLLGGKKYDFGILKLFLEKLKKNENLKKFYFQDWEFINDFNLNKINEVFFEISKKLKNSENLKKKKNLVFRKISKF